MHSAPRLSAVVTCFNSEATLDRCLGSVSFCDDLVVLDSGSSDESQRIADRHGARVFVEPFRGYAAQKQAAVDRACHDWIVLLDSDEWLDDGAAAEIVAALGSGEHAGYSLPRREWLFWRWQHPASRHNRYVRVFDRRRASLTDHAVHETVRVDGSVGTLRALIMHRGDPDLATKITKANRYSCLQQPEIERRRQRRIRARMVFYPSVAFLRYFLLRGHWREGWAGFVAARIHAFYAFAKYAKAYERTRSEAAERCT